MQLLLVRHAIALDRGVPGVTDDLRPLTEEGIARFRRTARSLAAIVTADLILNSPLLRAKQTAEILSAHWPKAPRQESKPLGTGSRSEFEEAISRKPDSEVVAAVGHEPWLSEWAADWLDATNAPALAFKKGGAALIEFQGRVARGEGRLIFFAAPKALKDLEG